MRVDRVARISQEKREQHLAVFLMPWEGGLCFVGSSILDLTCLPHPTLAAVRHLAAIP
jgi:hypothetical protein